jgi:N,N'-diacetyllegionaminate synthase
MSILIIAEAGMNHDGSLGNAVRLAEVAARAGADAVKFQLHDPRAETTRDAPSPPYFTHETRWEYFERTAFTDEEWRTLKQRCDDAGIEFLCSAFSLEAVERLERIGVARHKVPSGEVTNLALIRGVAATGKPVMLSSGMSSWAELDAAVEAASAAPELVVFQCTSEYPCPPERVGLNVLGELRERYGRPVGLSDHSEGPSACLAAAALGAAAIEKHFTLSKEMYGPDAALALEPDELAELVRELREIERMLAAPVDKADVARFSGMKEVFEKSVVSTVFIPQGETIERGMVAAKKPGTGIPARRLEEILGLVAVRDIPEDAVLTEADVDGGAA